MTNAISLNQNAISNITKLRNAILSETPISTTKMRNKVTYKRYNPKSIILS